MNVLAIDPGSTESAFVEWNTISESVLVHGIFSNQEISDKLWHVTMNPGLPWKVGIESVSSYGMPVGKDVFETCFWIGRIDESLYRNCGKRANLIYRRDIKLHLCGTPRAKDANVRQALIDRFGAPGTKKAPGKLYGIKSHEWSALALAVYLGDKK